VTRVLSLPLSPVWLRSVSHFVATGPPCASDASGSAFMTVAKHASPSLAHVKSKSSTSFFIEKVGLSDSLTDSAVGHWLFVAQPPSPHPCFEIASDTAVNVPGQWLSLLS